VKPVSTLVFDWGNTVMQVLPQYNGPMAEWEQVFAVPGITEALTKLKKRYSLALATNATDSDAMLVRKALMRIDLDTFFPNIFTYQDLGRKKPELGFFKAVEEKLGEQAHRLLMVGDDYEVDVLGSKIAGWQSAWFNPQGNACTGFLPLYDFEFGDMIDLPLMLDLPSLPDWETCTTWLMEQHATRDLFLHVQCVAAVAYQMAVWLRARGERVNPLLAHRGGLLHDLAKISANSPEMDHGTMAGQILEQQGQQELAEIARRHIVAINCCPQTWEQKLVFLADKLVDGSMVTGTTARLEKLRQRYPTHAEKIKTMIPVLLEVQASVCRKLNITEEVLVKQLRSGQLETYQKMH
jgi:putative hydrolase of the HAD superfamily